MYKRQQSLTADRYTKSVSIAGNLTRLTASIPVISSDSSIKSSTCFLISVKMSFAFLFIYSVVAVRICAAKAF